MSAKEASQNRHRLERVIVIKVSPLRLERKTSAAVTRARSTTPLKGIAPREMYNAAEDIQWPAVGRPIQKAPTAGTFP